MPDSKKVPPACQFDPQKEFLLKLDEVLPSDVSVIERVVENITALIGQTGCPEDLDKIELALREALANAILHGNRSHPTKGVRVCVAVQGDCALLIVVKDAGSGFDPARLRNPLAEENLLLGHGRGIFLINECMDDVRFGFDGGTTVTMRQGATGEAGGDGRRVVVYTLPGCKSCTRVKEFLAGRGVPFVEKNVIGDPNALQEVLAYDYSRMPVTLIDGQAVSGFNPARLEKLLA